MSKTLVLKAYTDLPASPVVWVDWWSSANADDPDHNNKDGMYLGVYAALGIASPAFMTAACWCAVSRTLLATRQSVSHH